MGEKRTGHEAPVIIKKYANRRLYNTATSSYVTLDHLAAMVREGTEFEVHDAKTGDNITRAVLAQIIFEEESKGGQNLLPIQFLRRLIKFYGDSMRVFLPGYLEASLETFARNQEAFRERMMEAWGGTVPGFKDFEEMSRANMAMFERAMRMWNPFTHMQGLARAGDEAERPNGAARHAGGKGEPEDLDDLKQQLDEMRRQIADLASRK